MFWTWHKSQLWHPAPANWLKIISELPSPGAWSAVVPPLSELHGRCTWDSAVVSTEGSLFWRFSQWCTGTRWRVERESGDKVKPAGGEGLSLNQRVKKQKNKRRKKNTSAAAIIPGNQGGPLRWIVLSWTIRLMTDLGGPSPVLVPYLKLFIIMYPYVPCTRLPTHLFFLP